MKQLLEQAESRIMDRLKKIELRYIVTGTGRCGTKRMSELLIKLGIKCAHENIFNLTEKEPDYSCTAESSWLAAPFLKLMPDTKILHLVRYPLHVIQSFLNRNFFSRRDEYPMFAFKHLPKTSMMDNPIDMAVHHYIEWNNFIYMGANNSLNKHFGEHRFVNMERAERDVRDGFFPDHSKGGKFEFEIKPETLKYKDIPNKRLRNSLEILAGHLGYE